MVRTIASFPNYTVDTLGIVRNKREKELSQQIYSGYRCVHLYKIGAHKVEKVHRLVAEAFIPNPDNLPCVNHKDENKLNNSASNLEWCDYLYNNSYGENAPLKRMAEARRKRVAMCEIDGKVLAVFNSATEAEKHTGIHQSNISKCCLKRPNFLTAGGYVWKFIK
jgi:hypothetical protein